MERKTACVICQKQTIGRCVGCKMVYYCSKEHQKEDWKTHKASCFGRRKNSIIAPVAKKHLSMGLEFLGLDSLFPYFDAIFRFEKKSIPIVEMGSGNGYVLQTLDRKYGNAIGIDNYCVPAYMGTPLDCNGKQASFSSLTEYLHDVKEKKSVDENRILFLNWPSPNHSEYDYDSFMQMKPAWCITILDTVGNSGGNKFLALLQHLGLELEGFRLWGNLPIISFENKENYKVIYSTTRYGENVTFKEKLCFKIVLLSRVCKELDVQAPRMLPEPFIMSLKRQLTVKDFDPVSLEKLAKQYGMNGSQVVALMNRMAADGFKTGPK